MSELRALLEDLKEAGSISDDSQESMQEALARATRHQVDALVRLCEALVARIEQLEGR